MLTSARYSYETDTKALKIAFVGTSLFVVVVFVSVGLYSKDSLSESLFTGFVSGAVLFALLWIYGSAAMFGRKYLVDSEGVSVSKRCVMTTSIRWHDIESITRGHMVVRGASGARIAFNIPPSEQRKARCVIEEGMRKAAQPGATDNPDDAQRLREDH